MISVFLFKVLEEKPKDILQYAGKYFDQPELEKIIEIESKHYDTKGGKQWKRKNAQMMHEIWFYCKVWMIFKI